MIAHFDRFACIDWSGARTARQKGIAIAICARGGGAPALVAPPAGGWSRPAVLDWLLAQAGAPILIGVDFSTALPFADAGAYFPGHPDSPADARALWRQIDRMCADDPHLAATSYVGDATIAPYFRVGAITGALFAATDPARRNGRMRRVEAEEASGSPASCFNLVGAKQVGLSSLTGMRVLHRLAGRIPVWPFDHWPDEGPLIVEIYTSIAAIAAGRRAGATKIRSHEALDEALQALDGCRYPGTGPIDDHSSDAIVTAAWLRQAATRTELWNPAALRETPSLAATEGWTFGVP